MPPALICLPPAGAGPSLYRGWQAADDHVLAPGLPGREGRFRETPPDTLEGLADLLTAELAPTLPERYGLFGYSMGGALAWLLAERLIAGGYPAPEALFVLGALAPDDLAASTARINAMDSPAFWSEIARIGGTPPEIVADAELRALFEPVLRRDFAACAGLRAGPGAFRLPCPVEVFVAAEDHLLEADASLTGWRRFTGRAATLHTLRGGHMLDAPALEALHGRIRSLWPVGTTA